MAGSFRRIDYRLRPAKHVERLMLCDLYRRLKFQPVERYQYVGMGSVYFSDFSLFHKSLGVRRMVSIEGAAKSDGEKQRFLDNRPFTNVEMLWGNCTDKLPEIDLSVPSIIWLDYDGRLDLSVLNDISNVAGRAIPGTALTISVQCNPDNGADDSNFESNDKSLLSYAYFLFGKDRIHARWRDNDLAGWGTARLFWELMNHELASVVQTRNGGGAGSPISVQQVAHFHYADGANMLTVAWVFFDEVSQGLLEQCAFDELEYCRPGEEAFRISLPLLTLSELRSLERQLPGELALGSIPPGDARKYAALYRYFPNFAVTSL